MRTNKLLLIALFSVTTLNACKKDGEAILQAPSISGLEVGSGNNKTVNPGKDLHIEAEIKADGNIANVKLDINPISGNGWKFTTTYTDGFIGAKNADFHEHIDVPADAVLGNYKVVITVADQAGKTTKAESDLKIVNPV